MTIQNSLYIGVNGLKAHSDAISVVGDNIANASTVGFKSERAYFADMLGGEINGQREGGGVRLGAVQTMFEQGQLQTTGSPTDLAINGHGLFVVKGQHDGQTGNFYTRNGAFSLNKSGTMVNPDGMKVQGYMYDSSGTKINTLGDLDLGGTTSPAVATTTAKISMVMDSDSKFTTPTAFDPANPTTTSDYQTSTTVYDSLGKAHTAQMFFHNDGGGNYTWHAMVDGGELTGGTPGKLTEIATGTLNYNTSGALNSQTAGATSANFVNATPGQAIQFTFGDDIATGGTGRDGSTMSANNWSTTSTDISGHGAGTLTDISVNSDGTIQGTFDNGDKRTIAQVAIASFTNEQGLTRENDNLYAESQNSGQALIDAAGTGKRGSIASGALEMSNVDLSNELVTLIAYQRAYEANSKTVTTADEMMSDVTNLKR